MCWLGWWEYGEVTSGKCPDSDPHSESQIWSLKGGERINSGILLERNPDKCRNSEPSNIYNLWLWGSGPYLKCRLASCSWKSSCDPCPGTRSWQLKLVISLVRLLLIDGPESFQMLLIASVIPFGVRFSLQSSEIAMMKNVCSETQLLHQWKESIVSNSISFTWIHLDIKHPLACRSSLKPEIDVFNWLTRMNTCFFPSYLNFIIKSRSHRCA